MRALPLLILMFSSTVGHATTSTCLLPTNTSGTPPSETELERVYALNLVRDYTIPAGLCSNPRYTQFLQDLLAALGSGGEAVPVLRIIVVDTPDLLERRYYNEEFDAICHDCPYYPFSYTAGLDAGGRLGTLIREQLRPHHLRLDQVRNEFRSLTGEDFQVHGSGAERLSDAEFFATIEANIAIVMRELKQLPAEQLQEFRLERGRLRQLPTVTVDSFGAAGELRPIREIHATLLQLYVPRDARR